MQFEYSTRAAARIVGASVRMVDYWARQGILRPSGSQAAGKGTKRRWTFPDIVALQAICELRKKNCPLQTIRKVIKHLAGHFPHETASEVLSRVVLITDGRRVFTTDGERQAMDVLAQQSVFCIPLGNIILRTTEQIGAMPQHAAHTVVVSGRAFRIEVLREHARSNYVARCRELPGAIGESSVPEAAFMQVKAAIVAYVKLGSTPPGSRQRMLRRVATSG